MDNGDDDDDSNDDDDDDADKFSAAIDRDLRRQSPAMTFVQTGTEHDAHSKPVATN